MTTLAYRNAFGGIYDLRSLRDEEPHNYLGKVDIFNVPHHVFLVRVKTVDGMQMAVSDPYNRLDDATAGDPGYAHTVEVPGLPGEYVIFIQPFRD